MNVFEHFRERVIAAVADLAADGKLAGTPDTTRVSVEPPKDASHGDLTTNAAMVLAKDAGTTPQKLAWSLVERLTDLDFVMSAEVAGPGFVNVRLQDDFWRERLTEILRAGPSYGDSKIGAGRPVNVEYVSANPTGPLHVGHGRGAVVGDALCGLLEKAGYAVTREYYINDAGAQVDALAKSAYFRYWQERDPRMDEAAFALRVGEKELQYRGDYLVPVGKALYEKYKDTLTFESDWLPTVRQFAIDAMMELIRADLALLGVNHKVFTSERTLVQAGRVDEAFGVLEKAGQIYTGVLEPPKGKVIEDWEPRPQVLFRATAFGDDVDRPLKKSDGSWTYFANDIANHQDKFRRGFALMINIWGADHGGYVKRVRAAVKALTGGKGEVDVKLCQLVSLMDAGQPVKMSKRAGTFVTLHDVIDKVGRDVVRFIMLTRKNDAQLEFDLTKATEQSRENPVFYVQYAHARVHSVLRHVATLFGADSVVPEALAGADLGRLTDPDELGLIKLMAAWPRLVENAAEAHEPHRVAFYLHDLAAAFHTLWNKGNDDSSLRFIRDDDRALTLARLALIRAVAFVIASGLAVMGVTPVEELRS